MGSTQWDAYETLIWGIKCVSIMIFVVPNQDVKDLTLLSYQLEANFHWKYNQIPDFSDCGASAGPQRRESVIGSILAYS